MHCSNCKHDNRDGARFCEDCGSLLSRSCQLCQTALRAGAKFCDECGAPADAPSAQTPRDRRDSDPLRIDAGAREPVAYTPKHLADRILQSRSALEGERKQVTVLFADVKGSMELAEQLDPEEWHRILERFFAILTEAPSREGTDSSRRMRIGNQKCLRVLEDQYRKVATHRWEISQEDVERVPRF